MKRRLPGQETPEELRDEAIRERDAASASAMELLNALEKMLKDYKLHLASPGKAMNDGEIEFYFRDVQSLIRRVKRGR